MKIMAIMGSPRKGDSYAVTRRLEEKLVALGGVEFEYLFLKEIHIQPCQGCFVCTSRGEQHCPVRDDCPAVLEKMLAADGVIFVSPVHTLVVSTLMKAFKDRLSYVAHRPRFFGKYAMAIATSAGTGLKGALDYLATFSIWGFEFTDKLGFICYPFLQPTPYLEERVERRIDRAARKFHTALHAGKLPSPSLVRVLQFRVLKCSTRVAPAYWLADHAFYLDKQDYYYPARISPIKKTIAWLFEQMYMGYMRKHYVLAR